MAELFLPLSIVMSVASFGLIGTWYVWPALRSLPRASALPPLLFLHSFRQIGLAFLITGVTAESLDPRFANPAAFGDLLAAVLALVAILALRFGWPFAIPLVWVFNIVGFIDLLNALFQGFRYTPNGHLGATYFIPAFIVPALLVTHVLVFMILLRGDLGVKRVEGGNAVA
jgi:hypothetical protein